MWITAASKRAFDVNFREGRLLIASGKLEFVLCIGRHQTHPSFPKLIDTSGHLRLVQTKVQFGRALAHGSGQSVRFHPRQRTEYSQSSSEDYPAF